MYLGGVMSYLFKSDTERKLAVSKLRKSGYGEGKTNYIYINGKNISVNGNIFSDLTKAKEYIKKIKIKEVLYINKSTFSEKVPEKVKINGVEFWSISSDKRK